MTGNFTISSLQKMDTGRLMLDQEGKKPIQGKTGFKGFMTALFKGTSMANQNKAVWNKLKDAIKDSFKGSYQHLEGENITNKLLEKYDTSKPLSSRKAVEILKQASGIQIKKGLEQVFGRDNARRAIRDILGSGKPVVLSEATGKKLDEIQKKAFTYEMLGEEGVGKEGLDRLKDAGVSPEFALRQARDGKDVQSIIDGHKIVRLKNRPSESKNLKDRVVTYDPEIIKEAKAQKFFKLHQVHEDDTQFDIGKTVSVVHKNVNIVAKALRDNDMIRSGKITPQNLAKALEQSRKDASFGLREKIFFLMAKDETIDKVVQQSTGIRFNPGELETIRKAIRKSLPEPKINLRKMIASGAFGTAFLAQLDEGGQKKDVVVKAISKNHSARHEALLHYLSTGNTKHPNIASLLDVDRTARHYNLIQEFIPGPTLENLTKANPDNKLNSNQARFLIRNLVPGLAHLKQMGFRHNDIKPENLIFNEETMQPVIIDIGGGSDEGVGAYTVLYCSPEQLQWDSEVTNKSDVYALGCTLGQLVTGKKPFSGIPNRELEGHRRRNPETPPFSAEDLKGVEPQIRDLLTAMTDPKPGNRPSLEQMMKVISGEGLDDNAKMDNNLRALFMTEKEFLSAQGVLADSEALDHGTKKIKQVFDLMVEFGMDPETGAVKEGFWDTYEEIAMQFKQDPKMRELFYDAGDQAITRRLAKITGMDPGKFNFKELRSMIGECF